VSDFCSRSALRELQNAAYVRRFTQNTIQLDPQRLWGLVVPLVEMAAKEDLAADASGWSKPLPDLSSCLAQPYGRLLPGQETGGEQQGD